MAGAMRDVIPLTFPPGDAVFAERVREALADMSDGSERVDVAVLLERRLRPVHPNVATRRRASVAGFGAEAIYVFRDGSALSSSPGDDSWVADESTARVVTDDAGRYLEANEAAAILFGVPTHEIVGREAGTFTRPDALIDDAPALWHALSRKGKLHSVAILKSPDGREERVEFVTIRDQGGPRQHVTYLRRIE
jgi:PAS domain-containing protein